MMANAKEPLQNEELLNKRALRALLTNDYYNFNCLCEQNPNWQPHIAHANLAGCALKYFNVTDCRFTDVLFSDANCQEARFSGSVFEDCRFDQADLQNTTFLGATLSKCRFDEAVVENTSFEGAHISETSFKTRTPSEKVPREKDRWSINFRRARIVRTHLNEAVFGSRTLFDYASFEGFDVDGPSWRKIAECLPNASWTTVFYDRNMRRREELVPSTTETNLLEPPETTSVAKLSIPKQVALRMASEAFLKACTDLIVEGTDQLPVAEETRQKLTTFFRGSKGQLLIGHLISFALESGIVDHLPLLTDGMKDVLRTHLPEELRASTFAKGFEELAKYIGTHLFRLLREANLGTETAEPAPNPPAPAALPEPTTKVPASEPRRQRTRVPRR